MARFYSEEIFSAKNRYSRCVVPPSPFHLRRSFFLVFVFAFDRVNGGRSLVFSLSAMPGSFAMSHGLGIFVL